MAGPIPIYGALVSFGTYTFQPLHSYLSEYPQKRRRPTSNLVNRKFPIDALAGGIGPLESIDATWVYWIINPDGANPGREAAFVEGEYNSLVGQSDVLNVDGTSGELQTLTVLMADNTTQVSCKAALIDATVREANRFYAHLELNVIFALYTNWVPA